MEEFKIIYRILKTLKNSMDYEEFDKRTINHKYVETTYPKWCRIMAMLVNNEYITGVIVEMNLNRNYPFVEVINPQITLKGLEYLQENSTMQKIKNALSGVVSAGSLFK